VYGRKRDVLLPALERKGIMLAGSAATFYLWVDVGGPSEPFARRLLEHGIVCAPGAFFGPAGEGYARFALVPTQAECERAAEIIGRVL
jgi:acetylornithine aminotransferase